MVGNWLSFALGLGLLFFWLLPKAINRLFFKFGQRIALTVWCWIVGAIALIMLTLHVLAWSG